MFGQFVERDPIFLERFAALPKHGSKRRYLARSKEELYAGSPHLNEVYKELGGVLSFADFKRRVVAEISSKQTSDWKEVDTILGTWRARRQLQT